MFRVLKVLKFFSENCVIYSFSCRGPKVEVLKLILSLIKRLTDISIRFSKCAFDALYNHTIK